jgi:hypothetical protein
MSKMNLIISRLAGYAYVFIGVFLMMVDSTIGFWGYTIIFLLCWLAVLTLLNIGTVLDTITVSRSNSGGLPGTLSDDQIAAQARLDARAERVTEEKAAASAAPKLPGVVKAGAAGYIGYKVGKKIAKW